MIAIRSPDITGMDRDQVRRTKDHRPLKFILITYDSEALRLINENDSIYKRIDDS
jgi:hypothetical protein